MRLYNVRPSEREFSFGKMSVVALGERGRARKETLVPFHAPPPTYTGKKISEESFYAIGVSRSGAPKIMRGEGASPGWIAVLSGRGAYTRGTYGTVYLSPNIAAATHPRTAPVQILAEGVGAFGLAGRIGEWHEFLVAFSPSSDSDPVIFYVRPAGGAHKMERYFLVFTASAVYRVYDAERAAFEAATSIILPPSIEGWLDLADVKTQEPRQGKSGK